jgi:hypothetical protein
MPNVVPIPLAMLTRPPTREADESAAPPGNVIATMLASSWPMNAPKQTTLTASHGARGFSLMTVGLGGSRKMLL